MSLEKYIKEQKDQLPEKKMPPEAKINFELLLNTEMHSSGIRKVIIQKWLIAASVILVSSLGIIFINKKRKDEKLTKQLVSSMVNESTSVRLEAIYEYEDTYKKEDDRLLKTLFELLHKDSNNNVKIAVIDALLKFPNNEAMRLQLVKALETEEEPLVQLKLIDAVMKLKEERAEKPLKKLIEQKQTFPEVKGNASIAMINLKNE
ncbi:HEAT repeat domain-containing protein [Spongiivirga sp. MCCC 1A20706]|uniref:HEAT repeat domain-containing protein n=1 Tax=Spongiivirga sp. MCCC 1A20706 TaxID=3160963 RepID=UPI003977E3FF